MARILAISSQVAFGHVGLSAIVPALQAMGHEVIALPTVLLSNHPAYAHVAGAPVPPDQLLRMLDALERNAALDGVAAIITGYLPTPAHVAVAREAVERIRRRDGSALFLCDPVLGDLPQGLYIAEDAAAAIRDTLVPSAGLVKLNAFELGWLTGQHVDDAEAAARGVRHLRSSRAVVTSVPAGPRMLANVLVESGGVTAVAEARYRDGVPKGTGDLLGGLVLGNLLANDRNALAALQTATETLTSIVEASIGHSELALVQALHADKAAGAASRGGL